MMAQGALLDAPGVGIVALGSGFWGFWTSIVIMTFGELNLAQPRPLMLPTWLQQICAAGT